MDAVGVLRSALFGWLALYRSGGWDALDADKRGGRKPKLDSKAMGWAYRTVPGNGPQQLKFPFALWTASLIAELIKRERGIKLSRWNVARLLRQLGLSPQKPLFRAYQQDAERAAQWKEEVFPKIQKKAKQQGALIYNKLSRQGGGATELQ